MDNLDGGEDDNTLYKSLTHGQAPQVKQFESPEDQARFIRALLEE